MMLKVGQWIVHETVLLAFILLSSLVMFLDAFPRLHLQYDTLFSSTIYLCMLYFLLEVSLKMVMLGFKRFFHNSWNQFDFCLVLASLPVLLQPWILTAGSVNFLILRIGRLVLLFKLLRFIPHGERIWGGMKNALKASVGIIFALLLLNFMFAMGANYLFSSIAPEFFGDPLSSMYTMFKVFTVEGWFEIPDAIAQQHPDALIGTFIKSYFIIVVLMGGILGLSIANAIFIDEMTMDNTDAIEKKINALKQQQDTQIALLEQLKDQISRLVKK